MPFIQTVALTILACHFAGDHATFVMIFAWIIYCMAFVLNTLRDF